VSPGGIPRHRPGSRVEERLGLGYELLDLGWGRSA
jgi:hypothetical protein